MPFIPTDEYMRALEIAALAHSAQEDKSGLPYITHPVRVSCRLPDRLKPAGLLHDVIEDTSWSAEGLLVAGISPRTVKTILVVTRQEGETRQEFYDRICESGDPDAWEVKLADVSDNLDIRREFQLPEGMKRKYRELERRLLDLVVG